jgi:hypothetical protein
MISAGLALAGLRASAGVGESLYLAPRARFYRSDSSGGTSLRAERLPRPELFHGGRQARILGGAASGLRRLIQNHPNPPPKSTVFKTIIRVRIPLAPPL